MSVHSTAVRIVAERPDTVDAQSLIVELDSYQTSMYPSESRHGFSVEKLLREEVAFFVMRYNEELAGCEGLIAGRAKVGTLLFLCRNYL